MNLAEACGTVRPLILLWVLAALPPADDTGGLRRRAWWASVDHSPAALAKRIQALVLRSPLQKLNELVAGPDSTIALAAAWERVRQKIPADTKRKIAGPYTSGLGFWNSIPGPEKADLARFLGLVEGRTQLPIPRAWEASVGSAKYNPDRSVVFPTLQDMFPLCQTVMSSLMESVSPRREGDHWIVEAGGAPLALPGEDPGLPFRESARVEVKGDMAYVALYDDEGSPYAIYAAERGKRRIIWSSKVWASGGYDKGEPWVERGGTGLSWQCVEMQLVGDRLGVFGISFFGAYVEVFDARTGENECRFSTSYFPVKERPVPEAGDAPRAEEVQK
jgi:hypothetical protein